MRGIQSAVTVRDTAVGVFYLTSRFILRAGKISVRDICPYAEKMNIYETFFTY